MGKKLNVSTRICILLLLATIASSAWLDWRHRAARSDGSSSSSSGSSSSDSSSSSSDSSSSCSDSSSSSSDSSSSSSDSSSSSSDSSSSSSDSSSSSSDSSSSSSDSSSSSSDSSSSSSDSSSSSSDSSSSSSDSSSSSSDSSSSSSDSSSSSSDSSSSSSDSSSSSSDSSSSSNCDDYDQVQCDEPENLTDGTVSYSETGFEATVTYACNDGFQLIGTPERTCLSTGMWSGTMPTCVPACEDYDLVQCNTPENLTDGTVSYSGTGFEDTVNYACNDGFQLIGSTERTCLSTGMWSGTKPTCVPACEDYDLVQCNTPENLTDGTVSYSGTGFEDTANYACNDGFQLIGSTERTCLSTAMWSGSKPTCVPACEDYDLVQCNTPENLTDGTVSYSGTGFEDTVNYACNDGFQLIGSPQRTCLSTGMWSGNMPTCVPSQCPALTAPENGTVDVTGPQPIGTMATYTCDIGLVSGDLERFCLADGTWSGTQPVCAAAEPQCPALTAPESGTVDVTGPQPIGTMATYTCDIGLLSGDLERFCLADGTWSGMQPVCATEEGLVCTFGGWKRKGCSANANVQSVECTVPNVDNIVIATVHQIAAGGTGNFQCNAATYPLADDATYAFTWYKDVIYMSDGCRAVFNVGYDTCVVDSTQTCTRKKKVRGCNANANIQSNICEVMNVDNIEYVTVHNAVAGHVCNPTSYPLDADATESYTWDGTFIYMTDDCRANFNVYYNDCEPVN